MKLVLLNSVLEEKQQILKTEKYDVLLEPFQTETERAKEVDDLTAADVYLVPVILSETTENYISPAKEVKNITLRSWTEDKGGPKGNRTYNEKSWTVDHFIPECKKAIHTLDVVITGYDAKANKILTYFNKNITNCDEDAIESYSVKYKDTTVHVPWSQFEFCNDFNRAKDLTTYKKKYDATIGFKNIEIPPDNDINEYIVNGLNFTFSDEALRILRRYNVIVDPDVLTDYTIECSINNVELKKIWHEPKIVKFSYVTNSESEEWIDKKGKVHIRTIEDYEEGIRNSFGYYSFEWDMNIQCRLIRNSTNDIMLSTNYNKNSSDIIYDYKEIVDEFHKEVKRHFDRKRAAEKKAEKEKKKQEKELQKLNKNKKS